MAPTWKSFVGGPKVGSSIYLGAFQGDRIVKLALKKQLAAWCTEEDRL